MMMGLISALNALNQPWIAILVIVIGMVFDVVCQHFNISNDAATGVIGAGVGLLTGQALNRLPHESYITQNSPPPATPAATDPNAKK